jgi:flagellin
LLSINTDTLNILMQKNLTTAQNAVSQALERMSTGYKVNKAQDNAAGLYIATNMTSQIRGLKHCY